MGPEWTVPKLDGPAKVDGPGESGRSWPKVDGLLAQSGRSWRKWTVFWTKVDGLGPKVDGPRAESGRSKGPKVDGPKGPKVDGPIGSEGVQSGRS